MTDTAMQILLRLEDFTLVETIGVRRWVSPGIYLRNSKGYWYNLNAAGGQLTRCKLKMEYGRLEQMLANALGTASSTCMECGESVHINPDGDWVHTSGKPRHKVTTKEEFYE